jgi:hypothetical protein
VKTFVIADRAFDSAHGETTLSLKLKRAAIEQHYRDRVLHAAAAIERQAAEEARGDMNGTRRKDAVAGERWSWVTSALWRGGDGGFATAAAAAAEPLPDRIEAVLERAESEIIRLRAEQRLYEPLAADRSHPAPLADAPPPPTGVFSRESEEALGDAGLWGLAVPEAFGGSGGSMLDLARSITRLPWKGPRSLMRTTAVRPLLRLVTLTRVPKGSVRWAAVMVPGRNTSPLAVRLP